MPVPQELAELPYAQYLEPYDGELAPEGDYTGVHVTDAEFEDFDAGNSRVGESAFTGVNFTNGTFARARLSDAWFDRTRWVGTELVETDWREVIVRNSFLAGIEAYGARLRRVTFQECKINMLNLRGTTVQDVVFDRCDLIEVDFGGAALTGVTFPGSTLRRARFTTATLKKVDFREATELDVAAGGESLGGAVIDRGQLADLAPTLAQALGITVRDR
jgi:uncharacterized protein YjbI with pentapeptide repeats